MKKPLFVISCPIDVYSGYSNHSRDLVKAIIELDKYDLNYYPYMDTMCFININENIVGNSVEAVDPDREYSGDYDEDEGPIRVARTTEGDWFAPDNY